MEECIVIFATAWGSRHGGINSFNYDLCKHLAKLKGTNRRKVFCIVDENVENESDQEVTLISLRFTGSFPGYISNITDILTGRKLEAICAIGHDMYTGERAIKMSERLKIPAAVFHHMDYEAYKTSNAEIDKKKIIDQGNLLQKADVVFAVGPKLEVSAIDKVRVSEKTRVVRIQPGLADVEPLSTMPGNFSAITFGRVKEETRILKQIDLAVASFGKALGNQAEVLPGEPRLYILGITQEEIEKREKTFEPIVQQQSHKLACVHEWPYEDDKSTLLEKLRQQSVCMMLSAHDGFGLTGLEAISAGVPLILSENTGLYQALTNPENEGGLGLHYPYSVKISGLYTENYADENSLNAESDIDMVVKNLYKIAKNNGRLGRSGSPGESGRAKLDALKLREDVGKSWTWEKTASQVLGEIIKKETKDTSICNLPPINSQNAYNLSQSQNKGKSYDKQSKARMLRLVPSSLDTQASDSLAFNEWSEEKSQHVSTPNLIHMSNPQDLFELIPSQDEANMQELPSKARALRIISPNAKTNILETFHLDENVSSVMDYTRSYLACIEKSSLKLLLNKSAPLPQLFEDIDFHITPIKKNLDSIDQLIRQYADDSISRLNRFSSARKLVKSSENYLNTLLRNVSVLKGCESRTFGQFEDTLGRSKSLILEVQENLERVLFLLAGNT